MDKTQLLALVQEKINEGVISKEDLAMIASSDGKPVIQTKNLTNIFYIIGGIIAVIGVVILLAQNWTEIGFVGRILSTLGISIVAYVIGFVMTGNVHRVFSQVFLTVSGILAPVGILVLYREFSLDFNSIAQASTAFALLILFMVAYRHNKRNILVLWSMLWMTWGYYSVLGYFSLLTADVAKLATMIIGISYLLLTYYFQHNIQMLDVDERKEKYIVENILYGIGTLLVIVPALFFGGIFDFITLLLVFGAFYLSIYVKSRLMLVVSGVLLISYILKITSKYFVDSIGWPLALIAIGFCVIAIGYGTLYVSRTYIPKAKV